MTNEDDEATPQNAKETVLTTSPARTKMLYEPVSEEEDRIGRGIVDAAFAVHKNLGPGLLESVYEACFCIELKKRGFTPSRQVPVPIIYEGEKVDDDLRLDVLVNDKVICELKSVETMHSVFTAKLLTYLKLSERRLGYLINFNVPLIKDGIKRLVR